MALIMRRQLVSLTKNLAALSRTTPLTLKSGQQLCTNRPQINLHQTVRHYSFGAPTYEGDGKTYAELINSENTDLLMINTFSQLGFRLSNGTFILGPMAIFPRTVLSWNVESVDDINIESLSLITVLEPKIDVLVIGTGDVEVKPAYVLNIMKLMKKYRTNVEILKTEAACSTFNFLNAESRVVAGLIIPPVTLSFTEDDVMKRNQRSNYFELEEDDSDFKRLLEKK